MSSRRVIVDDPTRHHQVARHPFCVLFGECRELTKSCSIEVFGCDIGVHRRIVMAGGFTCARLQFPGFSRSLRAETRATLVTLPGPGRIAAARFSR